MTEIELTRLLSNRGFVPAACHICGCPMWMIHNSSGHPTSWLCVGCIEPHDLREGDGFIDRKVNKRMFDAYITANPQFKGLKRGEGLHPALAEINRD